MTEPDVAERSDREGAESRTRLSRRAVIGAAVAGTTGLVVGRLTGPLFGPPAVIPSAAGVTGMPAPAENAPTAYPFFGLHQGGVATPAQAHIQLAAFDMAEGTDRRDLVLLLEDWSAAAARLTAGLPVTPSGPLGGDPEMPPEDTGEAMDLGASRLTVTIGFGPDLFERDGVDRFGIAAARPTELISLPLFLGDALDAARSGGDLCLQACADDPMVALHAVRNLARIAFGRAAIRWSQPGFIQASTTTSRHETPRNLMGFKDGTANIRGDDQAALDAHVWLPASVTPAWLPGGTYLVVRRIQMLLDGWDWEPLSVQEATFGRAKGSGAPLSGGDESANPDLEAKADGTYLIDRSAHIRLAHPSNNRGIRILRRGYNYVDGITPEGRLDGGLLFISYQRSPESFITIQQALSGDLLNDFIRHVGSALFVIPPGASRGGYVGETLLG